VTASGPLRNTGSRRRLFHCVSRLQPTERPSWVG